MSAIGRKKLRSICRRFIEASRAWYAGSGRRMGKTLIGSPVERNAAVKRVQNYQALLKMTSPAKVMPRDRQACNLIAELRRSAMDRKQSASMRCLAIARLVLQEGFEIERYWEPDAVDDLMAKHFKIKPKTEATESYAPTAVYRRRVAREQALREIRKCLLEDADKLCGKSVTEVADCLRLPEMPAPKVTVAISDASIKRLEDFYREGK